MVDLLVILDGAAEDPSRGPSSLELADTPVLDELCRSGSVEPRQVTPAGLPPGSEVGIPTLLGAELQAPPSRGSIEAAAAGVVPPAGMRAFRVDLPRDVAEARPAGVLARDAGRLGLIHLRGHRFLILSEDPPQLPAPWRVWPDGGDLPRILGPSTVVVCGPGAAAGVGRLMGARVVIPPGATGDVDTDLSAKCSVALASLEEAERIVVHVAAPDEASHRRDRAGKIAALEAVDELVLGPLASALARVEGTLVVCPDHGADPAGGHHLSAPVPCLRWGPRTAPSGPDRFHERALVELVSR